MLVGSDHLGADRPLSGRGLHKEQQMRWTLIVGCVVACAARAGAQVPQDYGLDFLVIGDPGNRLPTYEEAPRLYETTPRFRPAGAVNYEYRMMRNELTESQYAEFANAYWPFYDGLPQNLGTPSTRWDGQRFVVVAGEEYFPAATVSFYEAARMCNWMHNGKVSEAWAFETGAYDTSYFVPDTDGKYRDTNVHLPGALYWIPSIDEWIKGMYWDPEKDGIGGYWRYPHSSDDPPTVDETDAIYPAGTDPFDANHGPVGEYPDAQSPWGLLGGSGGGAEMMETPDPTWDGQRFEKFSRRGIGADLSLFHDTIDDWTSSFGWGGSGFRFVSAVPPPSTLAVAALAAVSIPRRRRMKCQ